MGQNSSQRVFNHDILWSHRNIEYVAPYEWFNLEFPVYTMKLFVLNECDSPPLGTHRDYHYDDERSRV